MLTKTRLILSSILISSALIACGDNSGSTSSMPIAAGTAEQAASDKLGTPTFTQSRTIDALTFTHSEWTNEDGTTSVQFHNGEAQYSQFVPAVSED